MSSKYNEDSSAVQSHLSIYQNVIQRMASNSALVKAWCITLVSAILVIVAEKNNPQLSLIAVIPIILFLFLDSYYLALEKGFRESYNEFIQKLHDGVINQEDLYAVLPKGNIYKMSFKSFLSFSVWPFYTTLMIMVFILKCFLL